MDLELFFYLSGQTTKNNFKDVEICFQHIFNITCLVGLEVVVSSCKKCGIVSQYLHQKSGIVSQYFHQKSIKA